MGVADLDESADNGARHQAEGAASELQRVDVRAHRLQHVFEVPRAHWRVVRPSDFRNPGVTGLWWPVVHTHKAKRPFVRRGAGAFIECEKARRIAQSKYRVRFSELSPTRRPDGI